MQSKRRSNPSRFRHGARGPRRLRSFSRNLGDRRAFVARRDRGERRVCAGAEGSVLNAVYSYAFADRATGRRSFTVLLALGLIPLVWV